ncbi:MAG TPA: 3-hydroxyacyl-CoA dehydrogenase NAD-binding domain-containing protein [Candidatus Limnocylindria bacterium]|nr:3-hydroxyacyl-CoA dehydrogenase NAD-binding domain-containing protein [Candidatus Limnocylindria bacterium]
MIVGIVGAGTMGAGIGQVCLVAGHEVLLYDVDHAAIERGRSRIDVGLGRLVEKSRLAHDQRASLLANLRDAHTLEGLASEADLVVEAALEDLNLKRTIFRALGASARPGALLATNTSALSVTAIAESSGMPERVLGLHFFNPAPVMPLVEVVAGDRTADSVVTAGVEFADGLGKTPVTCRDAPGFIVNRVNRPFTLEALRMLEAGEAGVEQVDAALVGAGYPMGPLALMDLVGIDVNYAVADALWHAFDEATRFRPSPIQSALVESGRLGRKTGEGFYAYTDGRPGDLSDRLDEVGVRRSEPSTLTPAQVVERIELAIINEAYHAVGEGVAEAADVDRAMRLGAGHPYGPFERAGALGLRAVIDGLGRLAATQGERYRVAPALWRLASI